MNIERDSLFWYRRQAYTSAVNQEFIDATMWCAQAMANHGFPPEDCANLAFLAFSKSSKSSLELLYDHLLKSGLVRVSHQDALFLRLSFDVALDAEGINERVSELYIRRFLAPRVLVRPKKPVFFWHIPKCSGTSLNDALGKYFYGTRLADVWPGYNYRPLVEYLVSHSLGDVPYASSVHLGMDVLNPGEDHFSFAVLRDPLKRCLSMFRQEMSSNRFLRDSAIAWPNYKAFARYGEFWDYQTDRDYWSWLQHIPPTLLRRQLSTLSPNENVAEALRRVTSLDHFMIRDVPGSDHAELFNKLGISLDACAVPTDLNRSDQSIPVLEQHEEATRALLKKEYELLAAMVDD